MKYSWQFFFFFLFPLLTYAQNSKIIVLGSAIVDHHRFVSEEELFSISSEKGGWEAIDFPLFTKLALQEGVRCSQEEAR